LRVVIVDDEPVARDGLRIRLERIAGVQVVGESGTASAAIPLLEREKPDVIYLDIQMPEVDGFGLLARLDRGPLPAVVFVTAHADRALDAFRAGALDYLVKPYDDDTLRESVDRVRGYVEMAREARHRAAPAYLTRLSVKARGQVRFIPVDAIDWIESAGDAVRLHAGREQFDYQSTMRDLEEALDPSQFVRIHRSAIVSIRAIAGFEPYSAGEHLAVLSSGQKLPMSRRAKPRVVAALGARR
jgi:two-component system LytT family response regulator